MTQSARKQWFIYTKGQQEGPFSEEEIREKITRKDVNGNVHIWCDGMENWKYLKEVDAFKAPVPGAAVPPPIPAMMSTSTAASGDARSGSYSNPTIVSKPMADELSALIAVPADTTERTGTMDLNSLQKGESEAAKAVKMARDAERSQAEKHLGSRPSRSNGPALLGVLILIVIGVVAAAIFVPSVQSMLPPPIANFIGKFISPISHVADVSPDDFEAMKRVAGVPFPKGGAQFTLVRSTGNAAAPVFYVGTNLPDGAKFMLLAKGNLSSIVGASPGILTTSGVVKAHIARLDALKFGREAVPLGDYQVFLTDADGEPAEVVPVIQALPPSGSPDGVVSQGRKLLVRQAAFLGGKQDEDYKVQLRVYHDRLSKDALETTQGFEQILTAIDAQKALLADAASQMAKTFANKKAKEKIWTDFLAKWAPADAQIDAALTKLAPYRKLSSLAAVAVGALRETMKSEAAFQKAGKKPNEHEAATKDARDKLEQTMRDFRSKVDDANQQAKTPWVDASLLEKN